MARPSKFNDDVRGRVLTAIAGGNTRETCAAYAGISVSLLYEWLERGRKAKHGPYLEFLEAVKKAEADAIVASVGRIRQAAGEKWQAAAWWLERKVPAQWGRQDRATLADIERIERELAEEEGLDPDQMVRDAHLGE